MTRVSGTPDPALGSAEMDSGQIARYCRWLWEVAGRPEPFGRWLWANLQASREAFAWLIEQGRLGPEEAERLASFDRLLARIEPTVVNLTSDILPALPGPEGAGERGEGR